MQLSLAMIGVAVLVLVGFLAFSNRDDGTAVPGETGREF